MLLVNKVGPPIIPHPGKTDVWSMMSSTTVVLKAFYICYKDLLKYVGISNIDPGFEKIYISTLIA